MIHENWDALVVEFPALFNEIFEKCVYQIDEKLKDHYEVHETTVEEDDDQSGLQPDLQTTRNLAHVFSDMPLSDVELEVEGKILKAHKIILWSKFILTSR
jgi:hypothetical protein